MIAGGADIQKLKRNKQIGANDQNESDPANSFKMFLCHKNARKTCPPWLMVFEISCFIAVNLDKDDARFIHFSNYDVELIEFNFLTFYWDISQFGHD